MDQIKKLTGIVCSGDVFKATEGTFVKIDGKVGVVELRWACKGRGGYTTVRVLYTNGTKQTLFSDSWFDRSLAQKPSSEEALLARTKLLVMSKAA